MKRQFFNHCLIVAILALFVSSCTKEDNNTPTTAANGLTVYKNKTGDVNANALQAQYKDPKFDIYFYGNFDANNDPTVIKTVSFQKAANDTIMNMTIDPATNRITSASTTVKGVQQAVVMKFDYLNNATNDFNLSYYNYNWTTQTGQLFYSTLIENKNGVTLGKPNYAARLNGTKAFDYKLALESLLLSTKIVTAGVVAAALIPEAALVTAAAVLIPGIATGWYFNSAVTVFSNLVLGGNVQAAVIFPPNTPIKNPIIDTKNPVPHLEISSCVNNKISFTATIDATGAIIFTTIKGGQAPYTYLVNSGFQQSTVFANNYKDGSYILAVKDANGCVNIKVIPLSRATASLCDDTTTPYPTVTIGTQTWMQKNLNVCKYRNGDDIPQVTDPTAWVGLTTGAWCYYANDTANGIVYGKLYNWYAVMDPRGLAPTGYHIPSHLEFTTLVTFLGGENRAGKELKETGTVHWVSPNLSATNSSGFTALPAGGHDTNTGIVGCQFWSSTAFAFDNIRAISLLLNSQQVDLAFIGGLEKYWKSSVRCVKD
jgi:uncharacterized protein (TIGR02145 family)